jgi:5-oxoprolinase (ATP-hydrolysing)
LPKGTAEPRSEHAAGPRWRIGVDVGGTFADAVATRGDGACRRVKLLTNGILRAPCRADAAGLLLRGAPAWWCAALPGTQARTDAGDAGRVRGARACEGGIALDVECPPHAAGWCELDAGLEAPVFAARMVTETSLGAPLPAVDLCVGTTRGTNALLEGAVDRVGLVVNDGLEGLLEVGTQQRLGLFDLVPRKPPVPVAMVVGVPGRIMCDGREHAPLDEHALRAAGERLQAAGIRHVAVALMHAWRNPAHEVRAAAILRAAGFTRVVTSSEMAPTPRVVPRAQTAVVDAALSTAVRGLLERIAEQAAPGTVLAGTSAGGIVDARGYQPKDSLLSGPALGAQHALAGMRRAGVEEGIGFDMGGTSTDVTLLGRHGVVMRATSDVAGITVASPCVDVLSVAAGGGSICRATREGLFVGPRSAGAHPGPACYGRGGPLTVTDVNLLLGRLVPGGSLPLDRGAAERAAEREAIGAGLDVAPMLRGFLALANEHMAGAVRAASAARGVDPRDRALVAFGGAGGQHACAVAAAIGIRRVLVLPDAGFVSGAGAHGSMRSRMGIAACEAPAHDVGAVRAAIDGALARARDALRADGVARPCAAGIELTMRVAGQAGTLAVALPDAAAFEPSACRRAFDAEFARVYGRAAPDTPPVVESVLARATEADDLPGELPGHAPDRRAWIAGADHGPWNGDCPSPGPAILTESGATVAIDAGWTAQPAPGGALDLRASEELPADPLSPEVAAARFTAIATWMGALLERTARSVNVKDRLDFSCGLLDADGRLCANAPHVPVHLGALGACVRAVLAAVPEAGDATVLVNHPAFGGSHLPDITVVRAVHDEAGCRIGFVSARAHHAEVGGIRPGSMPPDARTLAEEGVAIAPTVISGAGGIDTARVQAIFAGGPHPSRDPGANVDDVLAACAALDAGATALRDLARAADGGTLREAMRQLLARSATRTHGLLALVPPGGLHARAALDDGTPLQVAIHRHADRLHIDFTGSGGVHPGTLNAPAAVVRSAVLYVLRLLAGRAEPLDEHTAPLNEGFLDPVDVVLPAGLLNPPFVADPAACPPVSCGNTETSQQVVELLLRAFGAAAGSQGTMNNLVLGNAAFSLYETIGGGAGAAPGQAGASAVHVHMTNTRLTDPETLEMRTPVLLERLRVRTGSGGAGAAPGGMGIERRLRLLDAAELCFTGLRRAAGAPGLDGGHAGAPGEQCIMRADGHVEPLPGIAHAWLEAGDAVEIRTPGGGGAGAPHR